MSARRSSPPERVTQVVVGHANPDFDAYAAMVAATKLYPGAKAIYLGSQNANVREFHNLHEDFLDFADLKTLDLDAITRVVMVDTRDPGRIGELSPLVDRSGVDVVVYDHHPHAEGDITGAEDHSIAVGASTSILVHEIRDRGIAVTPLEASVLLLGIHEDTGSLTYLSTTPYDAEAVAFLLSADADLEVVNQFLGRALSAEQRVLLDALVSTLEIWNVHGQQVAVGHARTSEYVDSASVLAHYICEDLGYRIAIAVIDMPERLQVVGRSRVSEVDIAAVIARLGGGGHPQAASAALRDTTIPDVLERLRSALDAEVPPPLRARDIMTAPVRWVTPATLMGEAGRLMARWGHGGLPVLEDDALVGLVTRKDVDKAARHGLEHAPVKGFMARDPITVGEEVDLDSLQRLLVRTGIGRVPVMRDDVLVGIVTRKDLLRAEHGDAYLDRGIAHERTQASRAFMASFDELLPEAVRHAVRALGALAAEDGLRAHLVGGFVRDMMLGRRNLDVDIVIEGDGLVFAERAAARFGWPVRSHRRFGTAVLSLGRGLHVDVTSARTEYYTRPGALPTVERSSLRQDLFRRDFSINAMAACITPDCFGAIADPFGGLDDLRRGVVRTLHSLSFVEDPTRVLRAARFEVRYGFAIDASTEALLRRAVDLTMLDEVSGARIRKELLDILAEDRVTEILERLHCLGALGVLLPEGVEAKPALADVSLVASGLPALSGHFTREPRRSAALSVALGARGTRATVERWARRLRLGREYTEAIMPLVERGARLAARLRDRRRMRDSRLFFLLEALPSETVVYLWSTGNALARARIEHFLADLAKVRPEVTGNDLVALGLEPGPGFSAILSQARADRLDGRAIGREAELANLRRLAARARQA